MFICRVRVTCECVCKGAGGWCWRVGVGFGVQIGGAVVFRTSPHLSLNILNENEWLADHPAV